LLINRGIRTEVDYKMYRGKDDDDAWRVYDIKIEGVSLVEAYRADFSSYMGADCATGLIEKLRK
jgi:ABC-type transporter MlaC component